MLLFIAYHKTSGDKMIRLLNDMLTVHFFCQFYMKSPIIKHLPKDRCVINKGYCITVESRFLKLSVSRNSRYLEPNLVSIGFASLLYNFTPYFPNPRFLEIPDNSNIFWLPWDKLTLDNSNRRKFPNHLVRMSITFTFLNKLVLLDKLFSRILITQQASHKSFISLKGKVTASDCQHSLNWTMQSVCLAHSAFLLMMRT